MIKVRQIQNNEAVFQIDKCHLSLNFVSKHKYL